jgi:hypothetical protein
MNVASAKTPESSHTRLPASSPVRSGPPALAERHRRELHDESAIPDDVIAERGYRTVIDVVELLEFGFNDYQCRTPGYLVPLHGVDGSGDRYAFKPDHPRTDKDGKRVKYEHLANVPAMLDVPPRCRAQLFDPTVPLLFSEGAKKVDCAAGLGYCAVDLWGVHNWYTNPEHRGFATIRPLPDWDQVVATLDGRLCYLAFDSDSFSKASVGLALRRLANFLTSHGALVYIVHLPDAPDGSKQGLDDFVAQCGSDAFVQLVAEAEPHGSIGMVRHLQGRVRELEQQISAQAAVLRNTGLTATQKVVAIATVNEAGWRSSRGDTAPYRVIAARVAEGAGVSAQTASSAIKALSEPDRGLFDKRVTRVLNDDGQWRSSMELTPRHSGGVIGLLKATAVYEPSDRSAWGGRRLPQCPDHPGSALIRKTRLVCQECGQLVTERETVLNGHLDCSDPLNDEPELSGPAVATVNGHPHDSALKVSHAPQEGETSPSLRITGDQLDHSLAQACEKMIERASATVEAERPLGCVVEGTDLDDVEAAVSAARDARDLVELRRELVRWVALHRQRFAACRRHELHDE